MEVAAWMKEAHRAAPHGRRASQNAPAQVRCMRIAQHAARLLQLPYVAVATLDDDGQWHLKCHGLDSRQAIQSTSIFAEAALSDGPLVVEDARDDVHFATSPLVSGAAGVRLFAGAPLRSAEGALLGVLCVMGKEPRGLSQEECRILEDMAAMVVESLDLQGEHERQRAVLETIQEVVYEVDGEGRWTYLSPAWITLTGVSADESVGRPCHDIVDSEDRDRVQSEFRRIMSGEQDTCRLKVRFVRADGAVQWVALRAKVFLSDKGRPAGARGTLVNVEEWKLAEKERDRLVAELEHERTRLRYIFSHASAFICILRGPNHVYEMANPACLRLVGETDVVGKRAVDVIPESVRDEYVAVLDEVYRSGRPFVANEMEVLVRGESGEIESHFVNCVTEPLKRANGSVSGIFLHGVDVTEQVRAREEIARASRANQMIMDNSPDIICTADRDGRFLQVSAASVQTWGYEPDELHGRDIADFIFPADVPGTVQALAACVTGTTLSGFENRHVRKDGRVVNMVWSATWSDSDEVLYMVARDMTGQVVAETALRESEDRNKLLVDNIRDHAIIMLDASGCISSWNAGAEQITGYTVDEVIGQGLDFFVAEDDRPAVQASALLERALSHGRSEECRWHVRRDGSRSWTEITASSIWDEAGALKGYAQIWRDLTAQKQQQEELIAAKEQAEEMARLKDAFLANMSHEIRTPLTTIIGYAEVLEGEVEGSGKEYLNLIQAGGERLLDTLNSVLDLAQLESGSLTLKSTPFELVAELREHLALFESQASRKGLTLNLEAPEHPVEVAFDRPAFGRVLSNLISNALKFTHEGGVTVRVSLETGRVVVAVADTGIGMSTSFLPLAFEEFQQESSGISRTFEGSGLGLTISRRLVHLMGGDIAVASRKGEGTTFTIGLPYEGELVEEPEPPVELPRLDQPRLRVLVVEDSEEAHVLLRRLLEPEYEVVTVSTYDESVHEAYLAQYDIVLVDINLSAEWTGLDVLNSLRQVESYRHTPIVACTAYALPGDADRFLKLGFDGYVAKPFRRSELLSAIKAQESRLVLS